MLMQQFIIFMNKAQLYYNCPSFKKVKYLFWNKKVRTLLRHIQLTILREFLLYSISRTRERSFYYGGSYLGFW